MFRWNYLKSREVLTILDAGIQLSWEQHISKDNYDITLVCMYKTFIFPD
jgi:hypothetical protein